MRRTALMICTAAIMAACVFGAVWAQDDAASSAISTNLDLAYVSKYVWRGLALNPDPALQPSLTFTHSSGASFNTWGSMDTTNVGEQIGYGDKSGSFTEIDYTLSYAWAGKFKYTAGLVDYTFPHTGFDSTTEAYASVCFGGALSPSLSVNYDFDEVEGYYASLSFSYACALSPARKTATSLNFGARVSYASANYNAFYFGVDKGALTDLLLSASVPFPLTDKLSLTPAVYYSMVLDSDLRDAVNKPDNFVAGLTLSYAF